MGVITYFTMEDFQINFFITHLKRKQIDNLQEVDVRLPWRSSKDFSRRMVSYWIYIWPRSWIIVSRACTLLCIFWNIFEEDEKKIWLLKDVGLLVKQIMSLRKMWRKEIFLFLFFKRMFITFSIRFTNKMWIMMLIFFPIL